MTDAEMLEVLWEHAGQLVGESLRQSERPQGAPSERPTLCFSDQRGRLVLIELRRGTLEEAAVGQLAVVLGAAKQPFPGRATRQMVVAHRVPAEVTLSCKRSQIEAIEVPESDFRAFPSMVGKPDESSASEYTPTATAARRGDSARRTGPRDRAWCHWVDQAGQRHFVVFVNQFGSCSMRQFDADDGSFQYKPPNRRGDYQAAFSEEWRAATLLQLVDSPNLEDHCKVKLPGLALDNLQRDLRRRQSS